VGGIYHPRGIYSKFFGAKMNITRSLCCEKGGHLYYYSWGKAIYIYTLLEKHKGEPCLGIAEYYFSGKNCGAVCFIRASSVVERLFLQNVFRGGKNFSWGGKQRGVIMPPTNEVW